MERIVSRAAASGRGCEITVYETFELGSGRVWRRDQSSQFLMNTPVAFPTAVPSDATVEDARSLGLDTPRSVLGGLTFNRFRASWRDVVAALPGFGLTEAEQRELDSLTPTDYPRRAVYGAYLECVAASLRAALPAGVTLEHVRAAVERVWPDAPHAGPFRLRAGGEDRVHDAVILALGHVDAELNPGQAKALARAGERYFPPGIPCDIDWSRIPAGEGVVIRGMGLNFFDVVSELTQGRGGSFSTLEDGQLEYSRSGREPRVVALSRRGLPYAAKPDFVPGEEPREGAFATVERFEALLAEGPRDFDSEIWPLIRADADLAYWAVAAPEAAGELEAIREEARGGGSPESALARLGAFVDGRPEEERLDLEKEARLLVGRSFSSPEEHRLAVLEAVEMDARTAMNPAGSPRQHAVFALNQARWALKGFVARGILTEESRHRRLRGWFEPLVEGLASGPPSRRIAEFAALVRAGVVEVAGPSPVVVTDTATGRFRVTSPWVEGQKLEGSWLVEAMMPVNAVAALASPLVKALGEEGLARPHRLIVDGVEYSGTGFAVTGTDRVMLGSGGTPTPGLHCLGLQLSSLEWGTAIAAESDGAWLGSALTIADADAIADSVLRRGPQD
ncbi:FAD/NAD(P)-binding protein [Falsarthrobacter nasiphocae]